MIDNLNLNLRLKFSVEKYSIFFINNLTPTIKVVSGIGLGQVSQYISPEESLIS